MYSVITGQTRVEFIGEGSSKGDVGTIDRVDHADHSLPYRVRWDKGGTCWVSARQVRKLEKAAVTQRDHTKLVLLTMEPIHKCSLTTRGASALTRVEDTRNIDLDTFAAHFCIAGRSVVDAFERHTEWCYMALRHRGQYKHAYMMNGNGQVVEIVNPNFIKPNTKQMELGKLYKVNLPDGPCGSIRSGDVVRLVHQEPNDYYGDTGYFVSKINHESERWIPSSAEFELFQ